MKNTVSAALVLISAMLCFQQARITVEVPVCGVNGQVPTWSTANERFQCETPGSAGLPSGVIVQRETGPCDAGWTEVASMSGRIALGTTNGGGDVGTTGGSDSITPAGTLSGIAVSDHGSHTHTYTQTVNHVHVQTVNSVATGGLSGYTADTSTNTGVASGYSTANPTGGVATGTTAGPGAPITHTVSSQGTFTGTQFDNRSAWRKLIYCRKD